jgi:hypothetical protein
MFRFFRRRQSIIFAALFIVVLSLPAAVALASVDGTISFGFQMNDRRIIGLNANTNIPVNATPSITFSNGAGANQVNQFFQATRTFSGTTDNLNLASGLTDSYGSSVALVRVKAIIIINNGANTITIGNASPHPWNTLLSAAGTVTIPAGGFFGAGTPDATGWTITSGSNDTLLVTGTSGQTYQVVIAGSTT